MRCRNSKLHRLPNKNELENFHMNIKVNQAKKIGGDGELSTGLLHHTPLTTTQVLRLVKTLGRVWGVWGARGV